VLFVGEDIDNELLSPFRNLNRVEIVTSEVFDGAHFNTRLAAAFLTGRDRAAARIFNRHRIDVVFEPAAFYGWRFALPAIG